MVNGSGLFLTHKACPFDKMVGGMLDPQMTEDSAKIVNGAAKGKIQVNLISTPAPGNALPIVGKITGRLYPERQQGLF
jgi:hypothetical protein